MIVEAPRSGRGPGSHRPALALSTASLSHRQVTVTVAGPGLPGRGTAAAARPCHAGPGPPAGFSHGDLHARQPASEGGPGARPHWSRPGRRRPRPGPGGCGHGRRPGLGLQVTATRRRTVPRWASDTGPAAGRPAAESRSLQVAIGAQAAGESRARSSLSAAAAGSIAPAGAAPAARNSESGGYYRGRDY